MALPAQTYPSRSLAPWAEVVPDHGPVTVNLLLELPDDGYIYEAAHLKDISDDAMPLPFAPDLAIEVVSPDQAADAMAAKARRHLRAGTRIVWVVWPQAKHIDVWRRDVLTAPVRTLNVGDALDGEDAIPGFPLRLDELFQEPLRPDQAQQA